MVGPDLSPLRRLPPADRPGAREARAGTACGRARRARTFPAALRTLLAPVAALAAAGLFAFSLAVAPARAQSAAQDLAGDAEYGAYLAGECVTCHQESGHFDGIPPIVGWPVESFVLVMHQYQNGERDNQVMRTIAGRYNDEDLAALAAYFATLGSGAEKNTR
ncbi:sulfide dehydrogenase [Salinarimonas sp.]|uniref:c-type cytochrome n=1 Tax=Salinarimonas sp. TaxID=2766526 RepID=UPI0032D8C12B